MKRLTAPRTRARRWVPSGTRVSVPSLVESELDVTFQSPADWAFFSRNCCLFHVASRLLILGMVRHWVSELYGTEQKRDRNQGRSRLKACSQCSLKPTLGGCTYIDTRCCTVHVCDAKVEKGRLVAAGDGESSDLKGIVASWPRQ